MPGESWGKRVGVTSSFGQCHGGRWTLIHSFFSVSKLQVHIYSLAKRQARRWSKLQRARDRGTLSLTSSAQMNAAELHLF